MNNENEWPQNAYDSLQATVRLAIYNNKEKNETHASHTRTND